MSNGIIESNFNPDLSQCFRSLWLMHENGGADVSRSLDLYLSVLGVRRATQLWIYNDNEDNGFDIRARTNAKIQPIYPRSRKYFRGNLLCIISLVANILLDLGIVDIYQYNISSWQCVFRIRMILILISSCCLSISSLFSQFVYQSCILNQVLLRCDSQIGQVLGFLSGQVHGFLSRFVQFELS